ncbi:MAG: alpha/beta hydrolase [Clostridia bacterium]|nr:alpha/beta hydrolase [Clostridia bacterium]MBO7319122.1 alpha/beta hydrolase [Clostridia bacterium]
MFEKIIGIILSVLTMVGSTVLGITPKYEVFSDIAYGTGERNVMDIYVPAKAYEKEANGCILFIHGGSWSSGSKDEMMGECVALANEGYITATMSYTLINDENRDTYSVMTVLDEITLAIEAIKKFSDEKGLNITKLASSGYSAGAHLSMLYSYSRPEESAIPLAFAANKVGPSDFTTEAWGEAGPRIAKMLAGTALTEQYMNNGKEKELIELVSPVYYVKENSIPSLLAYGGKDKTVPVGNADSVKKAFEESGATFDFILFPFSDHILIFAPFSSVQYNLKLKDYCNKYFP